jgi:hypothetical protein
MSMVDGEHVATYLSVLKKSPFGDGCLRQTFQYDALPMGTGYTVTTYLSDGSPLPSFAGEPYLLPMTGGAPDVLNTLWDALDKDNRVSLAVKSVGITTGESTIYIANQYTKI